MKKVLLTLALVMFCLFVQAQTAMTTSEIKSLYKTQKRSWVSIHDPSVVWDQSSNYFYIYGSHYYGAKTKDFNTYTPLVNFYYGGVKGGMAVVQALSQGLCLCNQLSYLNMTGH